jgi:DNA-binding Lrp family transcriptional regulator
MDDWWSDIDNEILTTLAAEGPMEPAEVARRLGVTESSAISLITSLVIEGKVRVCLVEATRVGSAAPLARTRRSRRRTTARAS